MKHMGYASKWMTDVHVKLMHTPEPYAMARSLTNYLTILMRKEGRKIWVIINKFEFFDKCRTLQ